MDDDDPNENSFDTWEDLEDYADLMAVETLPAIPDVVKNSQAEIAFQVVYSHLSSLDPFGAGSSNVVDFSLEGMKFSEKGPTPGSGLFHKNQIDAMSIVQFYLHKYIARVRMTLF